MLLASVAPARATMDDDFFNFGRLQRQQPQPQPGRAYPYYGPGSDYYGGSSSPIPRDHS